MKKLLLLLAIALCLTSGYAQKNEYILQKTGNEIKLILKSDYVPMEVIGNIQVDNDLVEKYGESRILQAWQKDTVYVGIDYSWEHSYFGLKNRKITKTTFLVKQNNEIVEYISSPVTGEWEFSWGIIVLWVLLFIVGILCFGEYRGVLEFVGGFFVVFGLILLVSLIIGNISNGLWLPMVVGIFISGFGILLGYSYKKRKAKKAGKKALIEEEKENEEKIKN